jgi:hypothetical protein
MRLCISVPEPGVLQSELGVAVLELVKLEDLGETNLGISPAVGREIGCR